MRFTVAPYYAGYRNKLADSAAATGRTGQILYFCTRLHMLEPGTATGADIVINRHI